MRFYVFVFVLFKKWSKTSATLISMFLMSQTHSTSLLKTDRVEAKSCTSTCACVQGCRDRANRERVFLVPRGEDARESLCVFAADTGEVRFLFLSVAMTDSASGIPRF